MSRITKAELKKGDQLTVLGQSAFLHLVRNQRVILFAALILLLAGAGYVAWDQVSHSKELSAQEEFYTVEKQYLKLKESFDKAEAEQKDKEMKASSKKELAKKDANKKEELTNEKIENLPSGDMTKDYGAVVEGWNKIIDAHPSSRAAAMAALELSQLYLNYKLPKEALQSLSRVKTRQNSDQLLGAMVFHAYAKLLANQNLCAEAIPVWEGLEKKKKTIFLQEQAQMGRALCLESLGQVEKAEALYKEIAMGQETPMTPSKASSPPTKAKSQTQRAAEKYLRYIKMKKGMADSTSS